MEDQEGQVVVLWKYYKMKIVKNFTLIIFEN